MVRLFYTTYISVDLAHHEIFRATVGKGGIIFIIIVYPASSCASQPISLHRNLKFWPTLSHILSTCVSIVCFCSHCLFGVCYVIVEFCSTLRTSNL